MAETRPISQDINFHDSSLVKFELSDWLDQIKVILYAPNAGDEGARGRFYELTFDAVLRFEFEVSGMGEPSGPPEIYEVYLWEGEEHHRWQERMALLAGPDSFGNRTRSAKGYKQVYHVVLASSDFEGWGKNDDLDGIWIICRHIEIRDVTSEWPDECRIEPEIIPAGKERRPARAPSRRRHRR